MGKGGGGSSQPQTTTQKVEPWPEQQPYLKEVMQEAQKIYQNKDAYPQPYGSPGIVAQNPSELYAQQYLKDFALNTVPGINSQLGGALQFGLGRVLDPSSNANLQGYIDGSIRPIYQNLTDVALPAVRSGALQAGQYGGTRQGIAEGLAIRAADQTAADTTAKISSDAYQKGLDTFYRTLALTPQTVGAMEEPAQVMGAVGSNQRAYEQALLDDIINKYNYHQTLPLTMLNQYQNLVQGNYGGTSTSQALAQANGRGGGNPLMSGLSGAASGAMLGSVFPGIGTAVGAGVGGLIGLFGGR